VSETIDKLPGDTLRRKAELLGQALEVYRRFGAGTRDSDAVIAVLEAAVRGQDSLATMVDDAHRRVAESYVAAERGDGAAMTEYNSEEGRPFITFGAATTAPKFRIGQKVRKVSGQYQGPGVVRGLAWMTLGGYWLYVVAMQVAGGSGEFAHVFPGTILEAREDDNAT
jgi:hypothetical protein